MEPQAAPARALDTDAPNLYIGCLLLQLTAYTADLQSLNRLNAHTLPLLTPEQGNWLQHFAPRIGIGMHSSWDGVWRNKNELAVLHCETVGKIIESGTFTFNDLERKRLLQLE